MPYKDKARHRQATLERYKQRYAGDAAFREAEKERQKRLYARNPEAVIQRVMANRRRKKAAIK